MPTTPIGGPGPKPGQPADEDATTGDEGGTGHYGKADPRQDPKHGRKSGEERPDDAQRQH
jgi:hypothetical protein